MTPSTAAPGNGHARDDQQHLDGSDDDGNNTSSSAHQSVEPATPPSPPSSLQNRRVTLTADQILQVTNSYDEEEEKESEEIETENSEDRHGIFIGEALTPATDKEEQKDGGHIDVNVTRTGNGSGNADQYKKKVDFKNQNGSPSSPAPLAPGAVSVSIVHIDERDYEDVENQRSNDDDDDDLENHNGSTHENSATNNSNIVTATAISQEELIEEVRRHFLMTSSSSSDSASLSVPVVATATAVTTISAAAAAPRAVDGLKDDDDDDDTFRHEHTDVENDVDETGSAVDMNDREHHNKMLLRNITKKRRTVMWMLGSCVCIVIVGLVLAVVALATDSFHNEKNDGDDDRLNASENMVRKYLEEVVPDNSPIWVDGTPQNQAMKYVLSTTIADSFTHDHDQEDAEDTDTDGALQSMSRPKQEWARTTFVLATLYYSTGGPSTWIETTDWLDPAGSVCDWYGIECVDEYGWNGGSGGGGGGGGGKNGSSYNTTSATGIPSSPSIRPSTLISRINLGQNGLEGTIPNEIGLLQFLNNGLYLNNNNLTGSLPPSLPLLSGLEVLDVHSNPSLNGKIPSSFGILKDMVEFDISSTSISGNFPRELSSWDRIERIALDDTNLKEEIPKGFCQMINQRQTTFPDIYLSADCLKDGVYCPCCTVCCGPTDGGSSDSRTCIERSNDF